MLGTMKNVYLLEGLMKRYQRDKKDIYMVFRNLEKAYMEGFRGKNQIAYIRAIKHVRAERMKSWIYGENLYNHETST